MYINSSRSSELGITLQRRCFTHHLNLLELILSRNQVAYYNYG